MAIAQEDLPTESISVAAVEQLRRDNVSALLSGVFAIGFGAITLGWVTLLVRAAAWLIPS